MEFSLHYQGRIRSNDKAKGKHTIRRSFHKQIQSISECPPFDHVFDLERKNGKKSRIRLHKFVDGKRFNFLVDDSMSVSVDLSLTFLFPHKTDSGIVHRGDIDNRLKTLLDALRTPQVSNEIPKDDDFDYGDTGMFCLLEDDKVINKISLEVYQDHEPIDDKSCRVFMKVQTRMMSLNLPSMVYMG